MWSRQKEWNNSRPLVPRELLINKNVLQLKQLSSWLKTFSLLWSKLVEFKAHFGDTNRNELSSPCAWITTAAFTDSHTILWIWIWILMSERSRWPVGWWTRKWQRDRVLRQRLAPDVSQCDRVAPPIATQVLCESSHWFTLQGWEKLAPSPTSLWIGVASWASFIWERIT